ncbi:ASCH domain-containing protein [Streptomyces sp. M-16]|uniref:ASCH domain-containing protein n=1 Tax=Streptomyces sp. M-16 TaxID=3233040 RepID=UPI003F9AF2A2
MAIYDDLPPFLLGFPGELRDRLVAAVLSGAKTTTTGLLEQYGREGEPLPEPGARAVLVDSAERPLAVLELTEVRVLRLADVELRHAVDEGEEYASVAEWRASHERFWHSGELGAAVGDPHFTVDDDTLVVTQRFRILRDGDGDGERDRDGA